MKNQILNLGTALNKNELKNVFGSGDKIFKIPQFCGDMVGNACTSDADCCSGLTCIPDPTNHSGLGNSQPGPNFVGICF